MPSLSEIPKVCAYGGTLPAHLFERTITPAEILASTFTDPLKSIVHRERLRWEAEITEAARACGEDGVILVENMPFLVQQMPDESFHMRWAVGVFRRTF